jgi:hypothetical protein
VKEVIERLRASKAESTIDAKAAGREAGREWASDEATYEELRNLERFRDANAQDWDSAFDADGSAYGPEERFAFVIEPNTDGERQAARDIWECILGEGWDHMIRQEGFVAAFADGALEVWDAVKDKV